VLAASGGGEVERRHCLLPEARGRDPDLPRSLSSSTRCGFGWIEPVPTAPSGTPPRPPSYRA
jgi:hypothetical protein